jgi:hypothetical protein
MSATPFRLQAGERGACHIVNTQTHKCILTFRGKTARRRACRALEWLQIGYLSKTK